MPRAVYPASCAVRVRAAVPREEGRPIRILYVSPALIGIRLLGDLPDDQAGIAGRKDPLGDVPRDDAPGPDDRLRADADAGTNDGTPADPHVGANRNRLGELLLPPQFRVHRLRGGVDLD